MGDYRLQNIHDPTGTTPGELAACLISLCAQFDLPCIAIRVLERVLANLSAIMPFRGIESPVGPIAVSGGVVFAVIIRTRLFQATPVGQRLLQVHTSNFPAPRRGDQTAPQLSARAVSFGLHPTDKAWGSDVVPLPASVSSARPCCAPISWAVRVAQS